MDTQNLIAIYPESLKHLEGEMQKWINCEVQLVRFDSVTLHCKDPMVLYLEMDNQLAADFYISDEKQADEFYKALAAELKIHEGIGKCLLIRFDDKETT